ncbi:MAG: helix-turn-helix domain-containing protein [Candidatus Binatia bacterium]
MPKLDSPAWELPSRQELQAVTSAWERFVTGQDQQLAKVRPAIHASWQRATRLGIHRVTLYRKLKKYGLSY